MVKSILVATPHAAFGELIRLSLEENGSYHVTSAQNGADAQKMAARQPFDVAILDSELKDAPFTAMVQTIRGCRPAIKIVAALPSTNRQDPALGGVSVDGYLRKPFYLPDLLGVIGRLTSDDFMSGAGETDGLATLRDFRQATQVLAHLLPESSAQGALITQGNRIVAMAGSLSQAAANEVCGILEHTTRKTDLVRFVHLDDKDYQLYATTVAEDFMLATVYEATTPLTHIRSQVGRMAIALTTPLPQSDRGPIPAGAYAPLGVTAPLVSRSFIPQPVAPTMPLTPPKAPQPEPEDVEAGQEENIDIHELLPDVPPPDPDTLPQPDWLKELDEQPDATVKAPQQETAFPWEAETTAPSQDAVPEAPAAEAAPIKTRFPWEREATASGQEAAPETPSQEMPAGTDFPWESEATASSQESAQEPSLTEAVPAETRFPWETEAGATGASTGEVAPAEIKFPWDNEEPAEQAPAQEKPSAPPDFLKAYREPTGELTESPALATPQEAPAFSNTFVTPREEKNQQSAVAMSSESAPPPGEEATMPASSSFLDHFRSAAEESQQAGIPGSTPESEIRENEAPAFAVDSTLPKGNETAPAPFETVAQEPQRTESEAAAREKPFSQTASFLDRLKNAQEAPPEPSTDEAPQTRAAPANTFPPDFVPPWEEVLPKTAENAPAEPKAEPELVTGSPSEPRMETEVPAPAKETGLPMEEETAAEPIAAEAVPASFLPADFKPPWEEDSPADGSNPSEELSYLWEQPEAASVDETQPVRVLVKAGAESPVEETQPNAIPEPVGTFRPPTPAMQTRPLQSPWMAKTHPLARLGDSETPGITQATYTCVIVPRSPLIHLTGNLTEMLSQWVPQLSHSFGWRLNAVAVRPEYLQWTITVAPSVSPSDMIRILREHTSQRIFENFPRLKPRNPAEEFWANGYLIVNGVEPPAPEVLSDYIRQVHKRQSS
ncbi:MAG TPA: transposase [Longilinea sp.]|nr:transposase [Longilinea sp.]